MSPKIGFRYNLYRPKFAMTDSKQLSQPSLPWSREVNVHFDRTSDEVYIQMCILNVKLRAVDNRDKCGPGNRRRKPPYIQANPPLP